ncbi:MAG: tRNA-dihydrouridine synthase family protein [Chloroflexota bacterium]|jgi:nifR3 family TIM-barrel protein
MSRPGELTTKSADEPTFLIGNVPVYGDVILAPMAGFADVPTRAICRQFGSAMGYTEFVAAEDILNSAPKARSLLDFREADKPMVFQIFGNDARKILTAAQQIEALGPDIIDINMGCSTRRVSGRGAGVGMMLEPGLVAETFRLLSHHLDIPVTGKIRLGWESRQNYLEIARILEDNGAASIAIHPRTKEQKYRGKAHWDAIAQVREIVNLPVIGNGDVRSPEDIETMLRQTGCQAVMVGRGAIGNPWLFARVDKRRLTFSEVAAVIREHLELMVGYHGERGLILFRKHVKRYLAGLIPVRQFYQAMVTAQSVEGFLEQLAAAESQFGGQVLRTLGR